MRNFSIYKTKYNKEKTSNFIAYYIKYQIMKKVA